MNTLGICITLVRVVVAMTTLAFHPLFSQQLQHKNAIEVDFDSVRYKPHVQNLGGGIGYRRLIGDWIGVQVQASELPETQFFHDADSGGSIAQFSGSLLIGHAWKKVSLYGEAGYGTIYTNVLGGVNSQGSFLRGRTYQEVLLGGLLDIPVGRRISLTYEVRDNLLFIPDFTQAGFGTTGLVVGGSAHAPQGKIGVAFHF